MATTESKSMSYATEIDSTIEKIESHVEKETPTGVKTVISGWLEKLSEHKELSGIGKDLEKLQDALEAKDSKNIVALLTSLGKDTTAAAEKAEGKEGTKLKALGKALSAGGNALGKLSK